MTDIQIVNTLKKLLSWLEGFKNIHVPIDEDIFIALNQIIKEKEN